MKYLSNLKILGLEDTKVKYLDVLDVNNLQIINVKHTGIIKIDLRHLEVLAEVWGCRDNGRIVLTKFTVERH